MASKPVDPQQLSTAEGRRPTWQSLPPRSGPNASLDEAVRRQLGHYEPPSFPHLVVTGLSKLRNTDVALPEVAEVLAKDPRLTIKLLSLLNSPAYAFRAPVLSMSHAVSLLGRRNLEGLLLSIGVHDALPARTSRALESGRFWYAAARRAAVARALATEMSAADPGACFTAALLQDMAVPVLAANVRDGKYDSMLKEGRAGSGLAELEAAEYGWNHADVAGWMCERWLFPDELTAAIGTHHKPGRRYSSIPPPQPAMVACLGIGEENFGQDEFLESTSARTGLSLGRLAQMVDQGSAEAGEIAQMYG